MANLLPTSAIVKYQSTKKISAESIAPRSKNRFLIIKTKVIEIDKILKRKLNVKNKDIEDKKKEKAKIERTKSEERLEKKPEKTKDTDSKKSKIPTPSFFDAIKNFIKNVLLGFVLTRLIDYLPQLQSILPALGKAFDFMVDFTIGFVDGLGTFLKTGYDLYDKSKLWVKDKFGEEGVKKFEELSSALNKFFNVAIVAGIAATMMDGKDRRKPRRPREKPRLDRRGRTAEQRLRDMRRRRQVGFFRNVGGRVDQFFGGFFSRQYQKVSDIGKALKSKYDSATKAVGGAFNKLGNAAKEQVVKRIIAPAQTLLDPLIKRVKGIGTKIISQIENLPGFGRVIDALKKQGITNLGDAGKLSKKLGAKAIPVLGGILNLLFAYDRLAGGDSIGGLLEAVSGIFDLSGAFGFVPGPGISMAIDAYMFARDLIPGIQQGEEDIINNLGLGDLKGSVDGIFKKLPDLSTIVKQITGADKDKSLLRSALDKAGGIVQSGLKAIGLGSGYGSGGSKIAGELGRYVKKKGVVPGSIHEHPEHGGVRGKHSTNSYHYQGRAIDLGAYSYEQGPVLNAISEFNQMKGVQPVELLKAGDPGHSDHVHVAYAKGGFVNGLTHAMLGEKGREFVLDPDSTAAIEDKFPGFLSALNKADYSGAINVLRNYASYEKQGIQFMPIPIPITPTSMAETSSPTLAMALSSSRGGEDWAESLYAG
jgi:hypothetical protein